VIPPPDTITGQPAGTCGTKGGGSLSGVVVTADAAHAHRDNIEQILDRGGEYVLTVKGNQPTLLAGIKNLFQGTSPDFPPHHVEPCPWLGSPGTGHLDSLRSAQAGHGPATLTEPPATAATGTMAMKMAAQL